MLWWEKVLWIVGLSLWSCIVVRLLVGAILDAVLDRIANFVDVLSRRNKQDSITRIK